MTNRRPRKEFSKAVKVRRFDYCQGRCEKCACKLMAGQFDYDHDQETVEGGDASFENCRVLCKTCHSAKSKDRAKPLAKSRRIEEKHIGIKKPTKFRGWRKFNGDVVWNDKETVT